MSEQESVFDPGRYLTKVSGSDYLEVKWRLLWLRTAQPDAVIETEMMSHDQQQAIFRARVSIPGGGSATGWGSEVYNDFRDYIEKAETKALGRALAALGFGTQFTPEFEFGADSGRVVDSPVPQQRQQSPRSSGQSSGATGSRATDPQVYRMKTEVGRLGGNPNIVDTLMSQGPGISKADATKYIDQMINQGTIPPPLAGSVATATAPEQPRTDAPPAKVDPVKQAYRERIEHVLALADEKQRDDAYHAEISAAADQLMNLEESGGTPSTMTWKLSALALLAPSPELLEGVHGVATMFNLEHGQTFQNIVNQRFTELGVTDD